MGALTGPADLIRHPYILQHRNVIFAPADHPGNAGLPVAVPDPNEDNGYQGVRLVRTPADYAAAERANLEGGRVGGVEGGEEGGWGWKKGVMM